MTRTDIASVALIGCGEIASAAILPALEIPDAGLRLACVVEPNAERAQSVFAGRATPVVYRTHAEMLRAIRPDLIVVSTPSPTHFEILQDLATYDIPVLCEKPLVVSRAQLERICLAWQGREDALKIVHNYVYTKSRVAASELLRTGSLGKWRGTEVEMVSTSDYLTTGCGWRADFGVTDGAILDLAYHFIYLAEFLVSERIQRIQKQVQPQGFELCLEHDSGHFTKIRWTLDPLAERSSRTLTLRGSRGACRLIGARNLELPTGEIQSFEAPFTDGYVSLMRSALRRDSWSTFWNGHVANARRYLDLLFKVDEVAQGGDFS